MCLSEEDLPETFFSETLVLFNAGRKFKGGCDHFIRIAGKVIKVSFADQSYSEYIVPALSHLLCEAIEEPVFCICIWDSASTQISMPPPPWREDAFLAKGEIRGFNTSTIKTAFQHGPDSLNIVHLAKKIAVFWTRDFNQLPYYERSAPLKYILNLILKEKQLFLTHAACVGNSRGSVLMVGKGGSGKSTTALACLKSGMNYISDDYCLVSSLSDPVAFCLYNTAKIRRDTINKFAETISSFDHVPSIEGEKKLFFLHENYSFLIKESLPIKAILIPRIIDSDKPEIKRASQVQALLALAPSTIFQLPGNSEDMLAPFKELIKKTPCYFLELGRDISSIPVLISSVINGDYA